MEEPQVARVQMTPAEEQVLRLVVQDKRNDEIARALNVSFGTVRAHLRNMYLRLNMDPQRKRGRRTALIVWAMRNGYGDTDPVRS